jgi:hypothetical protein
VTGLLVDEEPTRGPGGDHDQRQDWQAAHHVIFVDTSATV